MSEGPERDPRALPLSARASALGAGRRGRPLGGGQGPTSEWRERAAAPWSQEGAAPAPPQYTPEQQQEIERLFEAALGGNLPRTRPLKTNEPETLNERHLAMIMLRATGLHQRLIAKSFGESDTYLSVVLGHPDSRLLLSKLLAMRATNTGAFQERFERLADTAMGAIEDAFLEDEPEVVKIALRRAPLAFKVLEQTGKIKRPSADIRHDHTHRLEATPKQLEALTGALRESRSIVDAEVEIIREAEDARRLLSAPDDPSGAGAVEDEKEVREVPGPEGSEALRRRVG